MPRSDITAYRVHTKVNQLSLSPGCSGEGRSVPLHQCLRKLKMREKLTMEFSQALLLLAQIPGGDGAPPTLCQCSKVCFLGPFLG